MGQSLRSASQPATRSVLTVARMPSRVLLRREAAVESHVGDQVPIGLTRIINNTKQSFLDVEVGDIENPLEFRSQD
jgi:hypothetical protein